MSESKPCPLPWELVDDTQSDGMDIEIRFWAVRSANGKNIFRLTGSPEMKEVGERIVNAVNAPTPEHTAEWYRKKLCVLGPQHKRHSLRIIYERVGSNWWVSLRDDSGVILVGSHFGDRIFLEALKKLYDWCVAEGHIEGDKE